MKFSSTFTLKYFIKFKGKRQTIPNFFPDFKRMNIIKKMWGISIKIR